MDRDEKFWSRVDIQGEDDCWVFMNQPSQRYGVYNIKIGDAWKAIRAHRYAYEQTYGPIPDGLYVCHSCDVSLCCNPNHLFLGTNSTNQKDAVAKYGFWREHPEECLPFGEDHHSAKLKEWQVIEIRGKYEAGNISQDKLAAEYGVNQNAISKIILRRSWKKI